MSRAWFALAVAGVLGLFYVGAGLRGGLMGNVAFGQEQTTKARGIRWQYSMVEPTANGPTFAKFYRTKVLNGWLVFVTAQNETIAGRAEPLASGLAFYPDPEHKWDGNSLP